MATRSRPRSGFDRKSDEVLDFYDTLKRWVGRASRPMWVTFLAPGFASFPARIPTGQPGRQSPAAPSRPAPARTRPSRLVLRRRLEAAAAAGLSSRDFWAVDAREEACRDPRKSRQLLASTRSTADLNRSTRGVVQRYPVGAQTSPRTGSARFGGKTATNTKPPHSSTPGSPRKRRPDRRTACAQLVTRRARCEPADPSVRPPSRTRPSRPPRAT